MLRRKWLAYAFSIEVCATVMAVGCRATASLMGPSASNVSGIYAVLDEGFGSVCEPAALPAPLSADTSQYVHLVPDAVVSAHTVVFRQSGSQLTMAALGASGQASAGDALAGVINTQTRVATLSRQDSSTMEGPRKGGHEFYVTHASDATTIFTPEIGTPSGHVVGMSETMVGQDTFAFHEGGKSGAVYTTCVVSDTLTGVWASIAP